MSFTNTNTTTTTTTPTTSALLERMLTKQQIAIANDLSSLSMGDLRTVATNGKGASRKLALEFVSSSDLDNSFIQFEKSGCKNVRALSILVRSITGKFTQTDSATGLTACPTNRAGFLEYPADVSIWARSSTNEKTNASRAKLLGIVLGIVARAQSMVNAYYEQAATEQAALEAEQAATEQAALEAEQAATEQAATEQAAAETV